MYVIAIAWLYVTVLMAATESSLIAGILTFVFYGAAPLALLLWLFGTPQRRRQRRASELSAAVAEHGVDDVVGEDNGANPRRDQ